MDLAQDLNPAQKKAVEHVDGPLLILAGAGSGKTRVLTYRIYHLIHRIGLDPYQILAVTFTNKAAREMKERLERLLGPNRTPEWVGTFHALSTRLLRREADHLGFRRDFVIYDSDDQLSLVKKVMKELNISDQRFAPEAVRSHISSAKDQLVLPEAYAGRGNNFFEQHVARIYTAYQEALIRNNAMDFDDLIMRMALGFSETPSVLQRYQERFQYILVDEYQDTNHAQYRWVNQLASRYRNLCVVGDDDQSIYAWRGADIRNILDFEKDYPEADVVRLEQNYRSTRSILAVGNAIIKNNRGRKGKELWTENSDGDKIVLMETIDERDEARAIARKIRAEQASGGRPLRDFTILYRTNAQSRALEDEFRRTVMPYVIVGGLRFYERKEVKDILAYLKIVANPRDSISFRRMVNTPPRGLGDVSVDRIENFALAQEIDLIEALLRASESGVTPAAARTAIGLGQLLAGLHERLDMATSAEIARRLVEETRYLHDLEMEAARSEEAESRAQNIKELLAAIEEHAEHAPEAGLLGFLEEAALIADVDRWDERADRVTLMTLHNAKGLEFPVVFIAGMEDGLFPIARAMESQTALEEERRLFYVGITRAQHKLFLSHANLRRRFGGAMAGLRSRFADEIPGEYLDQESTVRRTSGWGADTRLARRHEDADESPDPPSPHGRFAAGQRVKHPIWGVGRILQVAGSGDDVRATIQFGNVTKKVMVRYAALEKLPS
ncbi:MAG: UvrD-helicase domain-containing protein [candidate division Zixibacteria bacterium]|nr:UvrD-helicase domain-containing protein [candidate division Zixibacteria bacterium]